MLVSSIVSFAKKNNYFFLAFGAMLIDAINRLALGVNHIYNYQVHKDIPQPPPVPGSVIVVTNLWPSHIVFFIEVALMIFVLINLKALKRIE